MTRPSARVARNRRQTFLYTPALALGTTALAATFPIINGGYLAGIALLIAGAAGFVHETGKDND